jgi:hypothetical protein
MRRGCERLHESLGRNGWCYVDELAEVSRLAFLATNKKKDDGPALAAALHAWNVVPEALRTLVCDPSQEGASAVLNVDRGSYGIKIAPAVEAFRTQQKSGASESPMIPTPGSNRDRGAVGQTAA